jgi:cytochrome d ubiquinol oxidase subunit I
MQFAANITFHILFPTISIGMGWVLLFFRLRWLSTRLGPDPAVAQGWLDAYRFWTKVFALSFALGVVSGITMSFQFGTNWPGFMERAGNIAGPLLGYEVLTAFFLEAGFLGVMLFGMEKVGKGLHFAATCMVALGTFISAFWILSANSWMQTPVGFVVGPTGQVLPGESWATIIFNPSFPYRLVHTVIAAYLTTSLVVGATGAWHLLRDKDSEGSRVMFSMAMWMAAIVAPIQIFAGDMHGLNTLEHQPVKVMAMEGHFQSHPDGAPLILFGLPNQKEKRVDYAVEVPKLSSLILKHDPNAPLKGLDTVPLDKQPPVAIVFWSFRIMVGIGMLMLALGLFSLAARARRKLYEWSLLHRFAVAMGPSGFVAVIAGWVTTEVGRQPYTVYGQLLTRDSASPLAAPAVGASLLAFILVYFAVFGFGTWYILNLLHKGVQPHEPELREDVPIRAAGIVPGPAQPEVKDAP